MPDDLPLPAGTRGYTQDWFTLNIPIWSRLLPRHVPAATRILEIGAFEGRATVWMIENALSAEAPGEIHCVDTWQGGAEHRAIAMDAVELRFRANVQAALDHRPMHKVITHRFASEAALLRLHAQGFAGRFDLIYVDGSHAASDVLGDLVLSFGLCRVGGLIICDDYLWSAQRHGGEDVLADPRIAIDAFTTINRRRLRILPDYPLRQLYLLKTAP